ncbi:hypothetical protein [Bacillus sp. REN3]|uniref:hypothetical protein n=1 Tax=Bacillus sp. REN3 TaxID=2802440 RepID=UPI001AEDA167|nr:hypothetical protein [Bacillus sp. REN3]
MNIKMRVAGVDSGAIPYQQLAGYYYFFKESGVNVRLDVKGRTLDLTQALSGKTILLRGENLSKNNMAERMEGFLECHGVKVVKALEKDSSVRASMIVEWNFIKDTMGMEITHNMPSVEALIQEECRTYGIPLTSNKIVDDHLPIMSVKLGDNEEFQEQFGETVALILAVGIISFLLEGKALSPLAVMLDSGLFRFGSAVENKQADDEKVNNAPNVSYENHSPEKMEADAYFDSHLMIDKKEKVTVMADLTIKNTGSAVLSDPAICLRVTPPANIRLSGQILPPEFVQVMGVFSDEGAKGWKYMNEDWMQEMDEKGEVWIAPIGRLAIVPGQSESLSNLQMTILDGEENVLIEAFIFFQDQELRVAANNRISLSFFN